MGHVSDIGHVVVLVEVGQPIPNFSIRKRRRLGQCRSTAASLFVSGQARRSCRIKRYDSRSLQSRVSLSYPHSKPSSTPPTHNGHRKHTMSGNTSTMRQALLRVSPLVLSSASIMFSWAQDIVFKAFLHPSLRGDPGHPSGKMLPRYLPAFMKPGLWGIGLTFLPSTALCIANGMSGQSREVRNLYFAGAVLSIAHFCWGPSMFRILARISDAKTAGVANENAVEAWLPRHRQRTLLVNVPAFLCILTATLASMSEGLR